MATYSSDQLIINSPWQEPASYWAYHRQSRFFTRQPDRPGDIAVASLGSNKFGRELPGARYSGRASRTAYPTKGGCSLTLSVHCGPYPLGLN